MTFVHLGLPLSAVLTSQSDLPRHLLMAFKNLGQIKESMPDDDGTSSADASLTAPAHKHLA